MVLMFSLKLFTFKKNVYLSKNKIKYSRSTLGLNQILVHVFI